MNIVISIFVFGLLYIAYDTIKTKKEIKKNERCNNDCSKEGDEKRQPRKRSKKVVKNETQNKRKYNSTKKKGAKSKTK
jgi:amino acid permease